MLASLLLIGFVPFDFLLLLGTFPSARLGFLYFNTMELRVHCDLSGLYELARFLMVCWLTFMGFHQSGSELKVLMVTSEY